MNKKINKEKKRKTKKYSENKNLQYQILCSESNFSVSKIFFFQIIFVLLTLK